MRTGISGMAAMVWAMLAAACFDPTRQCSTNADCVAGGTCDPGTKTCVSAGNPNDKTPPAFSLTVAAPSPRQNTPKLTERDPGSPDGGIDAFRRDETVTVTVSSTDQDVDAGSVKLRAFGIGTGPVTPLDLPLEACPPGSQAASNPFCRQAAVPLASLRFDAFRGVVTLEATGSDLSNNVGSAAAGVNVTRWKWRYSAGAPIYTTPAIADDGTIVFGTSDGGSGSLYALTPAGAEKWAPVDLGPIKASPVIGTQDGGQQLAYVATAAQSGKLFALVIQDGGTGAECTNGGGGYPGPFLGTPALVSSGSGPFEGVLGLANAANLVNIRPAAGVSPCLTNDTFDSQSFPSNVVALGSEAYLGTTVGHVVPFILLSGNWVQNTTWSGGLGYSPVGRGPIEPLLIEPPWVVGTTSLRGIFAVDKSTGGLQANSPDAGLSADPGGPVLTADGYTFGGGAEIPPSLYSASSTLGSSSFVLLPEPLVGTPAAGSGGLLYLGTIRGSLECRRGASNPVWSASLGPGESFLGSPTIACGIGSAASLGILYIGSVSGGLFAALVDSPGLSATAPWPKYQHDARNTGNATTPIQPCP